MTKYKFNKYFKLNGNSFPSSSELIAYAKTLAPSINVFLEDWFNNEIDIHVYTSGSTGKPKEIAIKKEYMINSAKATGTFFDLPHNTTALLCLSTDYIAGKMMLVRALSLGWHLDVVEASSNPLKMLNRNYDFCAMVPMQVHHSLSQLHKIKTLIIGGGVVDNGLLEKLKPVPTEIFATYGMTETITHVAVKRLNGFDNDISDTTSIYRTLPNVKISIDLRDCLVIDAPEIAEGKIITNDLVDIISADEFKWLGRIDNVINSGGVKLIPEQIEEELSKVMQQRFFVAGIPDKLLGEKLVLIVEGFYNIKNLKDQILKSSALQKFEMPRAIYTIEKFVETDTKKINRRATLMAIIKQ